MIAQRVCYHVSWMEKIIKMTNEFNGTCKLSQYESLMSVVESIKVSCTGEDTP